MLAQQAQHLLIHLPNFHSRYFGFDTVFLYSPCCTENCCIAQNMLEFENFLTHPPEYWDYRFISTSQV